jgi:hypothetical protein
MESTSNPRRRKLSAASTRAGQGGARFLGRTRCRSRPLVAICAGTTDQTGFEITRTTTQMVPVGPARSSAHGSPIRNEMLTPEKPVCPAIAGLSFQPEPAIGGSTVQDQVMYIRQDGIVVADVGVAHHPSVQQ